MAFGTHVTAKAIWPLTSKYDPPNWSMHGVWYSSDYQGWLAAC